MADPLGSVTDTALGGEPRTPADPNWKNPYDPQSYTADQRVTMLTRAGYKYLPGSGYGPGAIWVDPMGRQVLEGTALNSLLSPAPTSSGDTSAQVDAAGNYFVIRGGKGYLLDGTPYTPVGQPARGPAGPTPRFGFQVVGDKVYRTNDLAGTMEDTGIVAPGFTKVDVDRNGDLIGIDQQGQIKVIQPGFDYAKTDPKVAAEEDRRRFEVTQQGMTDRTNAQEAGAFQRAVLNEQGANSRAALNAQTQGFNTMAQLTPQLGRLALDNNAQVAKLTSTPSDFLARAFSTRGGTSPMGMTTQADLINDLSGRIEGFNDVLSRYNANPFQGFNVPSAPAQAVSRPVTRSIPESTYVVSGPNAGSLAATEPGRAQANENMRAAGVPSWVPGFAAGGVTREPMFKVGEEPDGSMNDTSEVIANPTEAPIGVISNPELKGNEADDMEAEQEQKKAAAIGKVMQFVDDPKILHALVDEMDDHKQKAGKKMPGFAGGTGYGFDAGTIGTAGGFGGPPEGATYKGEALQRGFQGVNGRGTYYSTVSGNPVYENEITPASNGFRLPGVKTTTQAELQALEKANRPPAITSILNGERPTPLNLGFSLPTPGLLSTLTPDEMSAFGTTLATQYNLSPSDVESAIRQRFGGTGARSARF